jgi:putative addiction module component (TIGR02574 family)
LAYLLRQATRAKKEWLLARCGFFNAVCQRRPSWSKVSVVILEKIPGIRRLSTEEKLMLLTELWDELTLNPDEVTLTPDQEDLLDQRWRDYQKDPSQGTPWEVVKARVRRGTR